MQYPLKLKMSDLDGLTDILIGHFFFQLYRYILISVMHGLLVREGIISTPSAVVCDPRNVWAFRNIMLKVI